MIKKITGLDIGDYSIRAVEITAGGKVPEIKSFVEYPVADGDVATALTNLVSEGKVELKKVCTGLPMNKFFFRDISVPFSDKKRIARTLPFTLAESLPFPVEDASFCHYVLAGDSEGDGAKVVSYIARNSVLEDFRKGLTSSGVLPTTLSTENIALAKSVCGTGEKGEISISLHISNSMSIITFIEGGRPIFFKKAGIGLKDIVSKLSAKLEIDEKAAMDIILSGIESIDADVAHNLAGDIIKGDINNLISEVELAIRSFKVKPDSLEKIVISGEGSAIDGIMNYIGKHMDLEVTLADLPENYELDKGIDREELLSKGMTALGYAMMGLGKEEINFAPGSIFFAESLLIKFVSKQRRLLITGTIALLLLYTAGIATDLAFQKKRYGDSKEKINEIFKSTLPDVRKIVDAKHQMKVALSELEEKVMLTSEEGAAKVVDVIKDVSTLVPEGVHFRVTRMRIGADDVKIEGETNNFDGVEKIKNSMKKSKIFASVDVGGAKASRMQDVVEFQLKIKLAR